MSSCGKSDFPFIAVDADPAGNAALFAKKTHESAFAASRVQSKERRGVTGNEQVSSRFAKSPCEKPDERIPRYVHLVPFEGRRLVWAQGIR
jgi:hypothetical protein